MESIKIKISNKQMDYLIDKILLLFNNPIRGDRKHKDKMLYSRWLYQKCYGIKLNKNDIIHHVDFNNTNDNIENLVLLNRKEHGQLHRYMKKLI